MEIFERLQVPGLILAFAVVLLLASIIRTLILEVVEYNRSLSKISTLLEVICSNRKQKPPSGGAF